MRYFPAISITLEEIRHLYDIEAERRQSLENKAGILVGVIGVIITTVTVLGSKSIISIIPLIALLAIALLLSLLAFKLTVHMIPHKKCEDFYQYASMHEKKAMDEFLLNYIAATDDMEKKNNQKVLYLKISFILITVAWIYMLGWVIYTSR
ncbi:hypothetical protein KA005_21105 [bacterium]|nr:hypothetical protein [bacterium]